MERRAGRAVAVAAVAATALAACGGSNEPADKSASAGASGAHSASGAEREGQDGATPSYDYSGIETTLRQRRPGSRRKRREERGETRRAGRKREPARARSPRRAPDRDDPDVALVARLVNDLVGGMNAQDASICTELFDQRHVDPSKREAAVAGCRRSMEGHPGGLELVKIESVRLDKGAVGVVQFLVRQDGKRTTRLGFQVTRSNGSYRIAAQLPAMQPER
jgi:hypothetical protein